MTTYDELLVRCREDFEHRVSAALEIASPNDIDVFDLIGASCTACMPDGAADYFAVVASAPAIADMAIEYDKSFRLTPSNMMREAVAQAVERDLLDRWRYLAAR